jgi:hypothetical protein
VKLVSRAAWWICPAVLVAAAGYELAVAVGASGVGEVPGAGAPGEESVALIALLAIVAGAGLAGLALLARSPSTPLALYAPAVASFLIARFYTYDPYYAPTLRRYADGSGVSPWYVFVLLALSLAAGGLVLRDRRTGAAASAVLMLVAIPALIGMASH